MAEETTGTDLTTGSDLLELATELTMAWLSNPNTRASAEEVPAFLQSMHGAVANLASPQASAEDVAATTYTPAVTVRRSLSSKDHIISLIDGKPYKTLKRHLSGHGLTPAEYRERYGLKADYPMVAENYAEMRRGLAKKIGLGRKPETKVAAAAKSATKPATVKSEAKPAPKVVASKLKSAAKPAAKQKAPRAAKAASPETAPQS